MNGLLSKKREAALSGSWFDRNHRGSPLTCVAYFSMEFMLHEALPIYVGGLGNVAGDQLKSASDLGVPVVGVGLLSCNCSCGCRDGCIRIRSERLPAGQ